MTSGSLEVIARHDDFEEEELLSLTLGPMLHSIRQSLDTVAPWADTGLLCSLCNRAILFGRSYDQCRSCPGRDFCENCAQPGRNVI